MPYILTRFDNQKWVLFFLLLLLGFSVFCYKERMLFIDPSWITYNIINSNWFCFAEHRYGAFITQLFPLLGSKFGFSLQTILVCYSASFYLFYLVSAYVIGSIWGQKWLALLLVFYLTLFASDVFFWPNNEVHQGVCWLLLFFGLYLKHQNQFRGYHHVLMIFFLTMALSSHLLVIIPCIYLWIYLLIDSKNKINIPNIKTWLFYTIFILALIGVRYILSNHGWYDGGKLHGVKNAKFSTIINSFTSGQAKSFLKLTITHHWFAWIILLLSILLLLKEKATAKILLLIGFTFLYFTLVCITYPDGFERDLRWYFESEWMALGIIWAVPFCFSQHFITTKKTLLFLIIFGIIKFTYLFTSYSYFHHRYLALEKITSTLHENKTFKAIIKSDLKKTKDIFIVDWGLPVESMMLSNIAAYENQVTFKVVEPNFEVVQPIDSFYSCFKIEPIKALNGKYFKVDPISKYQNYDSLATFINDTENHD